MSERRPSEKFKWPYYTGCGIFGAGIGIGLVAYLHGASAIFVVAIAVGIYGLDLKYDALLKSIGLDIIDELEVQTENESSEPVTAKEAEAPGKAQR